MGVKLFQIQLVNSVGVYTAGQWINGQVIIDLDEPTKAKGVILKFNGAGNVHWSERHTTGSGKNRRTTTRHYRNHETYFNQQVFLWGTGQGGLFEHTEQHPVGQHVYPFQFQLPQNLPSSYEGHHGNVRYYLECVVDRPWKFDYKAKMPFTVNAVYDLNQQPMARNPVQTDQMKTLCCWCCKSGPITNRIRLERMGYVPGEYVIVNGEVDNKSNRKMTSSSLVLRQVTTFIATTKTRSVTQNIVHLRRGAVEPGETEVWNGQSIHIPPLPPSDLIYCNIINIKYYVVLIADPSGPAFDLEAPVEVIIGTVPLQNIQHLYSHFMAPPPQYNMLPPPETGGPSAPPPPGNLYNEPTAPPPEYSTEAPPPSYAQCVLGQVSIRDENDQYTHGNLDYAPQYTYYTWNK